MELNKTVDHRGQESSRGQTAQEAVISCLQKEGIQRSFQEMRTGKAETFVNLRGKCRDRKS